MSFKTKLSIAFAVGYFGSTGYFALKQIYEAKRLELKTSDEIRAMRMAHQILTEKIENGEYLGKTYADIKEDFEFFTIVNRNNV